MTLKEARNLITMLNKFSEYELLRAEIANLEQQLAEARKKVVFTKQTVEDLDWEPIVPSIKVD